MLMTTSMRRGYDSDLGSNAYSDDDDKDAKLFSLKKAVVDTSIDKP